RAREQARGDAAAGDRPLEQAVAEDEAEHPDRELEEQRERAEEAEERVGGRRRQPPRDRPPGPPEQPVEATRDARLALAAPRPQEGDEELAQHQQDQRHPDDTRE